MSIGRSKKPCIGCGAAPSQDRYGHHWTAKKPLCKDCREAIKNYKKALKLADRSLKTDLQAFNIPETHPAERLWPIYDEGENHTLRPYRDAFLKLCHAVGTPCIEYTDNTLLVQQRQNCQKDANLAFEPEVALVLRELHAAVCALANKSYEEGRERGSNLLNSLLEGSMTNTGINEICSRRNKG